MKIGNEAKKTILAENAILADTLVKRIIGLLGRKEFRKGQALILKPCNQIHTFFMRFPIDVLFVNKHNQIIKVVSSLKSSRLTYIYFNAAFVIELPAGTAQSTHTSKGDTIILE